MAKDLANSRGLIVGPFEDEPNYFRKPEKARVRGRGLAKLRLLWSRRRLLWRTAAIGLVISTAVAFLLPKQFKSTTRLMPPDPSNSGMMMMAALAGRTAGSNFTGLAGDLLGLRSTGVLFIGILQSRTVQDDLINRFDLRRLYSHTRWEDTRESLTNHTEIAEDRKTGIISITVTDKSPQRAAAMAQEYVDQLNRVITELNTSSAHRERVFLEERLGQVKQDLETAEKDFSVFASKNTAIDIKEQGKAMIDAAAAVEGEMIAAQTELESLRQVYTDNNVRVRATQARVDELKRQLKKIGGTAPPKSATQSAGTSGVASSAPGANGAAAAPASGAASDSATADAAAAGTDELYPSIRQLPILGVSYADLYRQTRVQEAVFETLTQQYELAKVEEAKETPSVRVLDPPDIPEKKSSPHRLWIMLAGMMLSFCGAAAWILGGTQWEQLGPDDPGKVFALEVYRTVKEHLPTITLNGTHGANGEAPDPASGPTVAEAPREKREEKSDV
jgi:uncharacterized protein involved in exopolysaccharide biosynthesis